ncbi:MAG: sodium:calcium symporter [Ignavibacteriales bacterium]|nr:sodium:calcium symporter [Ignavibacteriales bacterium]
MTGGGERWQTRVGLLLAVAGNAVGLGNFLRFPAQAVANGGGAFIIPYLVSFVLMGLPLVWIEWALGRYGGKHGHHSAPGALDSLGRNRMLKYFGIFGIFTNLAIAAYYSYIESWTLAYVYYSVTGAFDGMTPEQIATFFSDYLGAGKGTFINFSVVAIFFFLVTVGVNLYILARGVQRGIETVGKIVMPILLLFGAFLAVRALTLQEGELGATTDALEGLNFLWTPQFDTLANPKVWLAAAGQVFFTMSVGMGSILCYATYLRENEDVALNSTTAGFMNEFVEIVLGGSIIIPIAVAYLGLPWLEANGVSFSLSFMTIPSLFQNWGPFLAGVGGLLWFGLLFFAGITSSIAIGQPMIAFLQDGFHVTRRRASTIFGLVVFLLALPCVLLFEQGAFDEFDYWAGTFSLVVFALAESILFVWYFGPDNAWNELTRGAQMKIPKFFKYVITYVAPVFIGVVFIGALIKPANDEWSSAFSGLFSGGGWPFASDSVIGAIFLVGVEDPDRALVVTLTRGLLLAVFVAVGLMIRAAWKRNNWEGGAR